MKRSASCKISADQKTFAAHFLGSDDWKILRRFQSQHEMSAEWKVLDTKCCWLVYFTIISPFLLRRTTCVALGTGGSKIEEKQTWNVYLICGSELLSLYRPSTILTQLSGSFYVRANSQRKGGKFNQIL